jgi:hypothetical protein
VGTDGLITDAKALAEVQLALDHLLASTPR